MEQPLWLTVVQALSALSAPVVAFFTWKLAGYTRELVKAQNMSNQVLERQAEIQEAQQRLMELLEARPWLVLEARTFPNTYEFELSLSNAGRSAAVVEGIYRHDSRPTHPRESEASSLKGLGFALPLALSPGRSETLIRGKLSGFYEITNKGWIEIRYRALSPNSPLLSDLWKLEGWRFVLEWAGEEVEEG